MASKSAVLEHVLMGMEVDQIYRSWRRVLLRCTGWRTVPIYRHSVHYDGCLISQADVVEIET